MGVLYIQCQKSVMLEASPEKRLRLFVKQTLSSKTKSYAFKFRLPK